MLKVGELILYETVGVCRVKEISKLAFLKNDRVYYSIVPVFEKDTVIYVPVDNDKVKIRPVMTRNEAEEFIDQLPFIESRRDINEKERETVYKQILLSGDRRAWAGMIKGIFETWQARKSRGSRLAVRDEEIMKRTQKLLYGELAAALGLRPEEVPAYIERRLGR